jgi:hypothetical protein
MRTIDRCSVCDGVDTPTIPYPFKKGDRVCLDCADEIQEASGLDWAATTFDGKRITIVDEDEWEKYGQ